MGEKFEQQERRKHNSVPIEEVVDLAVTQFMTKMGFDTSDPISIQKDVQHLRKSRELCDSIKTNAVRVGTTAIGGGVFWAVWEGIKAGVRQ